MQIFKTRTSKVTDKYNSVKLGKTLIKIVASEKNLGLTITTISEKHGAKKSINKVGYAMQFWAAVPKVIAKSIG